MGGVVHLHIDDDVQAARESRFDCSKQRREEGVETVSLGIQKRTWINRNSDEIETRCGEPLQIRCGRHRAAVLEGRPCIIRPGRGIFFGKREPRPCVDAAAKPRRRFGGRGALIRRQQPKQCRE